MSTTFNYDLYMQSCGVCNDQCSRYKQLNDNQYYCASTGKPTKHYNNLCHELQTTNFTVNVQNLQHRIEKLNRLYYNTELTDTQRSKLLKCATNLGLENNFNRIIDHFNIFYHRITLGIYFGTYLDETLYYKYHKYATEDLDHLIEYFEEYCKTYYS
jgi:hypothetical protein